MIWLALLTASWAHGPPPAPVSVASVDDAGPLHVPLTEGLAVREGGGWRFVCPARWGSNPESPLSAVPGGAGTTVVPGDADLVRLGADGLSEALGVAALAASELAGWTTAADGASFALTFGEDGRELWRMDAPAQLSASGESWSAVAADGDALLLAAVLDGELVVATADRTGAEQSRAVWASDQVGYTPALRVAASTWLVERAAGANALRRWTGSELVDVAVSADEVFGPVLHASGSELVLVDDALWVVDGDALDAAPAAAAPPTCLVALGGVVYACVGQELWTVGADGAVDAVVLTLDGLRRPRLDGLDADAATVCDAEWLRIAEDLELDPFATYDTGAVWDTATYGKPIAELPCGCASPGGSVGPWALGLLWVAGWRRRDAAEARPVCGASPPRA